jgi:4-hydroxy-2-oxoheptanedioate aldolase
LLAELAEVRKKGQDMSNNFKQALATGLPQIGLWQGLGSPYTAEICSEAGFDWLLFDGEHSPTDIPALLSQLQAVSGSKSHAVGRPPVDAPWLIKQYLDLGFQTLMIPMVSDADQAAALVRACRYPPNGIRGVATSRASRWGRNKGYMAEADDDICVLVQVESRQGLDALEAICNVEGVDGVFIGPADLSASLGYPGKAASPEVIVEIERAIATIRASGKAAGVLSADVELARHYLKLGCLFIAVGTDMGLLVRGSDSLAAQFGRGTGQTPESGGAY